MLQEYAHELGYKDKIIERGSMHLRVFQVPGQVTIR